ncbi:flagellar hook-length control protein FliK [Sporosarcina sp. 179-K 3D1 HS]|uniref:flagellar hook-length control protein FliK n=1 Tax=Sporosarcina sp. 179-K 3D1 HS TaxID=3232169 RepID=UPI0039A360E1
MNLSVIQTMASMNVGNISQAGKTTGTATSVAGATFGSVFSSVSPNHAVAVNPVLNQSGKQVPDETILAIFNANSVEELGQALQELDQKDNCTIMALSEDSTKTTTETLDYLGNISGTINALDIQPEQLMEGLHTLLKQAGINESEVEKLLETDDVWGILAAIDQVAPQFFERLTDSLGGKGTVSQQQAIELLVLLKGITLIAPKTDLVLKQEHDVFSLGNYLNLAGERFENVLNSNVTNNNSMVQLVDGRQTMRFVSATETSQPMSGRENENSKSGQSDMKKEAAQTAVSSAHAQVSAKGEFAISELENRGSSRSETLLREMQAIMRRANLGQAGGTNRLLIKLYPEHLGQVRIELLETNGIMTARILASTALGKEMLDSQQAQLRQAFAHQNIQLDRLDISQTIQESNRGERDQNAFNGQFKREQQQSEEQQQQSGEEEMSFQEFMIELEV